MTGGSKPWRPLGTLAVLLSVALAAPVAAGDVDTIGPDGQIHVGADYYPEHWPKERWAQDAELMEKAGFDVVRLAEFAWVLMEPEEGRFDFAWLDEAIATLGSHGIKVVLGTPTAVMPAWVAHRYPETLAMKADGTRVVWGGRKNNCFSNGTYRLLSERITRAMAEHFKDNPHVIGWQTDNEFGGTDCRCGLCRARFQDWLRRRYGTTGELNRAWGTHFWGLVVQAWDEITIPDSREGAWAISNPSASLDWMRYTSWLNVEFQADQMRILRQVCPRSHFVTHNFMGLFQNMDYYELARDLDFVSWDNYPVFSDWEKPGISYSASFAADPGEIRKIAYQQLAHGADAQIWFRWRTSTAGREQYWHGLLGHDGRPGRRYEEAARVAREYRKLEGVLAGTTVRSDVAVIYDYDSLWALRFQPGFAGNTYQGAIGRYQRALFRAGVNVDMVRPGTDLSVYRLVLAPALHVLPDALARQLVAYVESGGVLLADARTGVKDETNLAHARTLPGLLTPALGIEIDEYESLGEIEYPVAGEPPLEGAFTATRYADWTTPTGATAVARYGAWPVEGLAAVSRHSRGEGHGWYVGTVMKEDAFYDRLVAALLDDAGIEPTVHPPEGVEVSVREGQGRRVLFVINHTEEAREVAVPAGKMDLLGGGTTASTLALGPYGVAVVRLD